MIARIGLSVEVPFQEALDGLAMEKVAVFRESLPQRVNKHCPQWAAQPLMSGNVEAGFLPLNNRSGQFVLPQFTEYELLLCTSDFQPGRELRGKFHDSVVEKWRAHFHGVRHTHAVALHQNIVRQIVLLVEPEQGSKKVCGPRQLIHLGQKLMERSRQTFLH